MDSQSAAPPIPIPLEGTNGTRWQGLLEVFQAFHKWTNTYQPAATVKQTFFGRPASRLCSLHRDYPEHRHLLLQRALPACLPGWRRVLEVAFGSDGTDEAPLRSLVQRSAPDSWEPVLDDVHLGFESPTGDRVMVRATLEQFPAEFISSADCFTFSLFLSALATFSFFCFNTGGSLAVFICFFSSHPAIRIRLQTHKSTMIF